MAIRLKVIETKVRLKVSEDTARLKAEQGIPIYSEYYTGETTVIPGEETQILNTAGLMVSENITIEPIPSNYGRIAYNGTALLVY